MNSSDTRISSYLDTLARLTADLDPATRDDVIAGVREHLDAALADHPDDPRAVDAALLRLGPPEDVAAAARADAPPRRPAAAWATAPVPPRPPTTGVARLGAVLVALTVLVPTTTMGVDRVALLAPAPGGGLPPSLAVALLTAMSLPWLAGLICVLVAHGLATRTRVWLALIGPIAMVVVFAGTFWLEPRLGSGVISVVAALVVATATVVLARRAWREVR